MVASIRVSVVDPRGKPVTSCEVYAINYSALDNRKINRKIITDKNGVATFDNMDTGMFGGDRYSIYAIAKDENTGKGLFGLYPYLALYDDDDVHIECVYFGDKEPPNEEIENFRETTDAGVERAKDENSKRNEKIDKAIKNMEDMLKRTSKEVQDLRQRAKTNGVSDVFDDIDELIQRLKEEYRKIIMTMS